MLSVSKHKRNIVTLIVFCLFSKSIGENVQQQQVKDGITSSGTEKSVTLKVEDDKVAEKDVANIIPNSEEKNLEVKSEKVEQPENSEQLEKNEQAEICDLKESKQNQKAEDISDHPPQLSESDPKQAQDKVEGQGMNQQPAAVQKKVEEKKSEDSPENSPQKIAEEEKKQNVNSEENNRKISLSDVNAVSGEDGNSKEAKRDTAGVAHMEFLGLPRDASYFFDDLEPFINNNSGNPQDRVGRAIPTRENKMQRGKVIGRKENLDEEDEESDDEDGKSEDDDEKPCGDEGDYDDDEDIDSDCHHTTDDECTSSSECTSTTESSTTTPCVTTPPKCKKRTTKFMCPTKCPTTEESTKCPPICVKAKESNRYPIVAEKTLSWNPDKKKTKKKSHFKERAYN